MLKNIMLDKLMEAAKNEEWDKVDKNTPEAVKDPEIVNWAFERGLDNPNENIRDLAAGILEKAKIPVSKFSAMRPKLHEIMGGDKNPYARYRSAFALAAHNPGFYKPEVIKTLKEAEKDEDVSKIASSYLRKLEN